jgi:hypothetical protein
MKSLPQLLNEAQKTYSYRLKTVVDLDDIKLESLERLLKRYKMLDIGHVHKIDSKNDTLEFRDIENADVYYIDFMIGVPVSAYILQQELRAVLNVPEKMLVVRADNEPVEVYSMKNQLLSALWQKSNQEGYTSAGSLLSTDRQYLDVEQPLAQHVFGDTYNSRLLNLLKKVSEQRKNQTFQTSSDLNPIDQMHDTHQQPEQDTHDFNHHLPGVKPVYKSVKMDEPVEVSLLGPDGNFDDDTKRYFVVAKNTKGIRLINSVTSKPIRRQLKDNK